MIDKKELISTYLQQFGSHYQISRLLNPTLRIDDEFISHFFEQVVDQYGETFAITEEEKTEIERKIKSQYCIFQDEGAALVGDYEHDFMWYANLQAQEDYDEYYWPRYKAHLENKNFSPAGIDTLENKTLPKLMSYIGNPNEDSPFSIRGLVVGDVQSGKTSNYLGLITKAADAGYKVIFLLTGTIESLRRQTQKRVEEGFIGYDSVNAEDVGVGRGSRTPKAFTSRNNDFTGKNDQNTTYKINDNASEPMIFVIKKNVSVLKKLYASLKNINTSSAVSQITVPMIMIDDEADNASINTNKKDEDPTKINNYIRKILTLFARNTYVGFTATPFANVFISYDTQDEMLADDLFPRHFIYSLESPSNYCGAQKYFFESNSNVRFINDYDDKVFPLRHKKEWDGDKLFPSFYHSINVFLLANAIRDIREVEKNTHRSMLINMSRFTDVQFVIKEIVENYFADMKRAIKQNCRCKKEDYMRNSLISALYESYELEYADNNWFGKTATWDQVFERLPDAIKDIEIAVVNSSRNSNKLDYSKHERDGLRVIAIGGLALSRGLTLEENLQFTRAVNNGKQTKKIFISHKEEHKLYGQFIVDVLETYGVDVVSTIIFTGDRRLGVPQGKDIYDYLKDCFREDLMVIFLFSKAFYDSNICISEAGAAWATNQNCMNVVIDISFSDIEKPSNNALSSIKFQQIRTPDQTITVTEFFKTIIEEGLHFEYDESKLQKALNYVLKTDKYSDQKIDFPATFLPKRKFLPVPRCPKCHNIMLLTEENGRLKYVCSNVSCDECYEAVIN